MKIINIIFTSYLLLSFLSCKKEEVKIDYNNAVATLINYYFMEGGFTPPPPPPNKMNVNIDSIKYNWKHKIILNDNFSDTLANLMHLPLKDWAKQKNNKAKYIQISEKITLDTLRNIHIKLMKVDTTIFTSRIDNFCDEYKVDGIFTVSNPFYFKQNGTEYFAFYIMYLVDGFNQTELAVLLEYRNKRFKVIKIENFQWDKIS